MAIGTTNYPTALDTLTELIRVVDAPASSTIDTGGVTNVATTIPVVSTTGSAADGVALICTFDVNGDINAYEIVSYTGKTASTLTGAVRGFGGTAQAWSAGAFVYFDVVPMQMHVVLANAIIALETRLGTPTTAMGSVLILKAGTATAATAPLKLTSGTLLTTAESGAIEFDGVGVYGTIDTTSGRGRLPTWQEYRLAANGSASGSATITDFFPATSSLSLAASSIYKFEAECFFTKTTAGTMVWTLLASSAPTAMTLAWDGPGVATSVTNMGATTAATTVVTGASASLTTALNFFHFVYGTIETNAACNIRLRGTPSAGTFTPLRNSTYRVRRIGSANSGNFV